ncbi:MAG TPA: response regulator [Candidatus Binataceae bacterium]|nr:response regulator [Candidatus Binataceae bacterium]
MRFLDSLGITNSSEAAACASTSFKGPRASVLLVDDSPDNLLVLREYLKKTPHLVDEAPSGAVALAKVRRRKYDIIIMDLLMPEMDGFETTRRIRQWEDRCAEDHACIIALTAWALTEASIESHQCGADVHLTKPISSARLLKVVNAQWSRIVKQRARRIDPRFARPTP